MDREINLDNQARATITLVVAGSKFRIRRVVTGVRQLYGDLVAQMGEELLRVGELQDLMKTGDEAAIERRASELAARVNEFAEVRKSATSRILELLLSKNGYNYDAQWWEENADQQDVQGFIAECLRKDVAEGDEKKTAVR